MKSFVNIKQRIVHTVMTAVALLVVSGSLQSCHVLDDDEGDCTVRYQVAMRFTRNILEANAFASQVKSVTLLVYDKNGALVTTQTESGSALQSDNYIMTVDVKPGTYDLVAWCGLADNKSFTLNNGATPETLADAVVTLHREHDGNTAVSDQALTPLFHAIATDVTFPSGSDVYGDIRVATMDLTKDTNTLRFILTHYNAGEINPDDFTFTISDNNGRMNYDNSLLNDEIIVYRPWTQTGDSNVGEYDFYGAHTRADINSIHTVIAEIDMARLMVDHNPYLTIRAAGRDHDVLSLPIIQLLLYAKGEARRSMSDQEYLDRQDEYTIQFFVNNDNSWYMNAGIYINGWHMRYQSSEM